MTTSSQEPVGLDDDVELEIELLVEAIYRKYSYDFRHYARASLRRRVVDSLAKLSVPSVSLLQHGILRDRDLFTRLLTQLTVPVSDLFRDPGYFRALHDHVLPLLATYPSTKVWVAGCSTGEEVYSLAILLEEAQLLERTLIYATDINPEALRTAESGVYAMDRVPAFTRNYQRASGVRTLADYYTAAYGHMVFDRRLRSRVTFSDHCLATDAVFAEVHLVSCRNVLIYFNRSLQNRAVDLFHTSLCRRGFLGLGSKETIRLTTHATSFTELVPGERVYQKRDAA